MQALSRYDERRFDVYDSPVDVDLSVSTGMVMLDRIRKYNWNQVLELVWYGFVRRFGYWIKGKLTSDLPPLTDADDALVCSSYVTQVLSQSGWTEKKPGLCPTTVAHQMGAARLHYRPSK